MISVPLNAYFHALTDPDRFLRFISDEIDQKKEVMNFEAEYIKLNEY